MGKKNREIVLKIVIRDKVFKVNVTYLAENWGAPFIIAFMVLLLGAALYLCYGLEDAANTLAIYAYYMLVVGVVLQFICYLKYGE
jgi:hypothetical protein